eukprot:TRINITY_DN2615_c0_g1_i1.p1 TRINITY_DN2615_c0_g1~~TRINITY_DN2615_c0_g1_i1.p1  ORF type:complete len:248 (-),score=67.04 TRINITY_DN2615_c0_g1_i1:2-745(-)
MAIPNPIMLLIVQGILFITHIHLFSLVQFNFHSNFLLNLSIIFFSAQALHLLKANHMIPYPNHWLLNRKAIHIEVSSLSTLSLFLYNFKSLNLIDSIFLLTLIFQILSGSLAWYLPSLKDLWKKLLGGKSMMGIHKQYGEWIFGASLVLTLVNVYMNYYNKGSVLGVKDLVAVALDLGLIWVVSRVKFFRGIAPPKVKKERKEKGEKSEKSEKGEKGEKEEKKKEKRVRRVRREKRVRRKRRKRRKE